MPSSLKASPNINITDTTALRATRADAQPSVFSVMLYEHAQPPGGI